MDTKKTYRSKKRDEPRLIEAIPLSPGLAEAMGIAPEPAPAEAPGSLYLHIAAPAFIAQLRDGIRFNRRELEKIYSAEFKSIERCMDDLWTLLAHYQVMVRHWADADPHEAHDVILPSIVKSIMVLHSAHYLTASGLYGSARPLLRQAFEGLMLAKLCAVNPASDVYDRWVDGIDIYFTNAVLKRITYPNTDEFKLAWKVLNQWSHPTIYAGQPGLTLEEAKQQTLINLGFCEVFVRWMYHLISTHIATPTVRYHADRYGRDTVALAARTRLRKAFKFHMLTFGQGSRRLVRDFRAKWRL